MTIHALHSFASNDKRMSCSEFAGTDVARHQRDIADVFQPGEAEQQSLKAETEAAVWYRTVSETNKHEDSTNTQTILTDSTIQWTQTKHKLG